MTRKIILCLVSAAVVGIGAFVVTADFGVTVERFYFGFWGAVTYAMLSYLNPPTPEAPHDGR